MENDLAWSVVPRAIAASSMRGATLTDVGFIPSTAFETSKTGLLDGILPPVDQPELLLAVRREEIVRYSRSALIPAADETIPTMRLQMAERKGVKESDL
jgi:hypothetical protein